MGVRDILQGTKQKGSASDGRPGRRRLFPLKSWHARRQETTHWNDSDEMHEAIHALPGHLNALILEMLDKPMSCEELQKSFHQLAMRMGGHHAQEDFKLVDIEKEIAFARELGVIEELNGNYAYALSPKGREMAEHMQEMIPQFFNRLLSEQMVSLLTIAVHVLLSAVKLGVGVLSRSAGLIADGIDNTVDTFSSVLVWLGISYDKEKPASFFIVVMMFISVGGVAFTTYQKIISPQPVREGLTAFVLSAICGLLMLGLSAYQYLVGKRRSNFALMCQAVDSRNHVLTSLLVCGGILPLSAGRERSGSLAPLCRCCGLLHYWPPHPAKRGRIDTRTVQKP